jgi:hypothetical protein
MPLATLVGWFTLEICHDQAGKCRKFVIAGEVRQPERRLDDIKLAALDLTRDKVRELAGDDVAGLSCGEIESLTSPAWKPNTPMTSPAVEWLLVWDVREE